MSPRVPHDSWSGPRGDSWCKAMSRRDKSPGDITFNCGISRAFFIVKKLGKLNKKEEVFLDVDFSHYRRFI